MPPRYSNSSWGAPTTEVDSRVLRSYTRLLARLATLGEIVHFTMLAVFLGTAIWLLVFANLENIIFYDGTATTCVLDGATQEIFHVQ